MPFPVSPGVNVSEIDLTTSIPAVAVSTGAFAGRFNWGPVNYIVPISSEVQLAAQMGDPDNNTAESFFTVANFLSYSSDVRVVRSQGTGMSNATGGAGGTIEIDNPDQYFMNYYPTTLAANNFVARYPGALGNSLKVYTFANTAAYQAIVANTADPAYGFAKYFNWAPNTTPYVAQVTNGAVVGDELHILVVDAGGLFSGKANTVLEVYQGLSRLSNALDPYGMANYYKEVIWKKSKYIYAVGTPSANVVGWGNTVSSVLGQSSPFGNDTTANVVQFASGNNGIVTAANTITALELFSDPAFVDISLLMTGVSNTSLQNYAIQEIAQVRKDCVVFASAPLVADQDPTSPVTAVVGWAANVAYSSYAILDSGYKYQYDKYNDVYRYIPLNGDIAGLCARTDQVKAPWWSPAGLQRGVINNVVKLAFNPGQTDRDTLYQAGVNPVVSLPGQGTLLYGDKTHLNYSSAFDHINVRRLFIVLEKQISIASRAQLFEFNDTFTRAQFVSLITPYLRTVQGQRGITAFQVVCDTTNNTPDIIDANKFVGDIYIQPARSINYIQLNFVAVATGVSFSEVVGSI